jgi:hypothetical protein
MQRTSHALAGVLSAALLFVAAGCAGSVIAPPPNVTPAPHVAPSPSQSTISFGSSGPCVQAPCTTSFTVSEPGYNGTFTAKSSDTTVVTVTVSASTSQARKAQDATATIVATAVNAGTATITVSDQSGNSTAIPVSVSSLTFQPQLQR